MPGSEEIVHGLFTHSPLAAYPILKGGNGLRKAYLPNTRFSKDLDFSVQQSISQTFLEGELKKVCDFVERHAEVHFSKEKTIIKNKDLPIGVDALEARLYFKGFYGDENLTLKAQLDITQFDKIYLPVQERRLLHPYSDNESCVGIIRCHKIEEILASKLTTLLHRRKAIDLFDLLYSIIFTKEFPVERLQVIITFLKKSIFEPRPSVAKEQLLAVPLDDFKPLWSTIVAPVRSLFDFDYVVSNFKSLIESLFETVIRPIAPPSFIPASVGGAGMPRQRGRPAYVSPSYFSWGVRAALGGPIRKNKAFFFVSYQGTREANGATDQSLYKSVLIAPGLTDDRSTATLTNTFGVPSIDPISLNSSSHTLRCSALSLDRTSARPPACPASAHR